MGNTVTLQSDKHVYSLQAKETNSAGEADSVGNTSIVFKNGFLREVQFITFL